MLVGRSAEIEAVHRVLDDARAGRSRVLVLRGEPGIGKSALLEYAAACGEEMRVLRAVGVEAESELAFAALHQILRPVLDRIGSLPAPQAAALRSAFALSNETVEDRFRVSLGVLSLLAEVADERPLLCLVDDAQWLDGASADALLFTARRLEAEPLALLLAAREDDARPRVAPGLPELRLRPLAQSEARELVAQRLGSRASPSAVEWVVANANGNPLALVELPQSLPPGQQSGREALGTVLPRTTPVEEAYVERVARLPAAARTTLVIAAAESTGERGTIVRAAIGLGVDPAELSAAEDAGLVRVDADRVEFRHPLVRSAVYRGASFAERERAHLALASIFDRPGDADRRAWHRAAATVGPSAEVADELEQTAHRARLRSGYAGAASALERAAELSVDPESTGRRLVEAADAAWHAGQPDRATALLDRALPTVSDAGIRAALDHLRGVIEWRCGAMLDASTILVSGAERVAPVNPRKALEMLFDAGTAALNTGDYDRFRDAAQRAAALPQSEHEEDRLLGDLLVSLGSLTEARTAHQLPLALDVIARAEATSEPRWLSWAAAAATLAGDESRAEALLRRASTLARESGAVDALIQILATVTVTGVLAGRLNVATEATEGLRLANEAGLPQAAGSFLAGLGWYSAVTGDDDRCLAYTLEAKRAAAASGNALAASIAEWANALLALGRGRPEETISRHAALRDATPATGHPMIALLSAPDLVEAYVRAGRREHARRAFDVLEHFAESGRPAWALALAARCRGLLSEDAPAEREFARAVVLHAESRRPFDMARTELVFGEQLRRERRPVEARAHLRAALESFETLRAAPWEQRARSELRASGETRRRRDASTLAQLTAQELQVAQFVARGLSNKEVAAQLFLSPRTIEYHLRKVFMKLDITSRAELIRSDAQLQPSHAGT